MCKKSFGKNQKIYDRKNLQKSKVMFKYEEKIEKMIKNFL